MEHLWSILGASDSGIRVDHITRKLELIQFSLARASGGHSVLLPCLQVELTLHLLPEWPSRDIENKIPLCPRIIHGTESSYSFIQSQTQEIHSGLQKYSPLDLCPGFLAPEGSWLQCGSLLPRTGSANQYNRAEQLTLIAHRCLSHCVQDSVELSRFSRKKHHD